MQTCPRHGAAVDIHGVKQCDRRDFPKAAGRPFNGTKNCFHHVVFKLERDAVLVVMPCPPQCFGEGNAVVAQHDPVNGKFFNICFTERISRENIR